MLLGIALLLLLHPPLWALSPQEISTPVEELYIPCLTPQGRKKWELFSQQAVLEKNDQVLLKHMRLFLYDLTQTQNNTLLISSEAIFLQNQGQAYGNKDIFVKGTHFTMQGIQWRWSEKEKKIWIDKEVHVCLSSTMPL